MIYSSGEQANVDTWGNYNWVLPESYFTKSIANGILTVTGEYRGTTVGDKRTGVLTLRLNSVATNNKMVETSLTLTQDANVKTDITYGNIYITYFIYPDIPASGGSVKTGNVTYSQTYGWNGATTGAGVITEGEAYISWTDGVDNIPSLGTTVKS